MFSDPTGIQHLKIEKGLALQDILYEVHSFLHRSMLYINFSFVDHNVLF